MEAIEYHRILEKGLKMNKLMMLKQSTKMRKRSGGRPIRMMIGMVITT